MAPKAKRAWRDSSHSHDKRRFVSKSAAERYHNGLVGKVPIVEHEFEKVLCNASEHKNFKCLVRGHEVPFDSTSINEFYNITPIELAEYENFCEKGVDYDELTRTLCPQEYVSFKSNCLDKVAKIWLWFIFARMLPTSHSGEVTADRTLLLYCIMTGKVIDIGKIISDSIIQSANSTRDGLWFLSLITKLCTRAGVKWDKNEELIFSRNLIDNTTMLRILNATYDEATGSQLYVPRPIPGLVKKLSVQEHRINVESTVDYIIDYMGALARSLGELSRVVYNHIGIEKDKIPEFELLSPPQHPLPGHLKSEDEEQYLLSCPNLT
ncbi:hypothetical protein CDL12_25440 [Handroanthus impetiginosus]|uniref:Putative plant transposon protein domain-containing protein n=1 Tax=Handroanthus impetiginosus TaxID=429701 RepID=A0A2G9G9R6_9LAMI|nr:hypothetical protein CDL12_25440 [Handroanthus impetiginosus]